MQIIVNPKDNNTFASASLDRTGKFDQEPNNFKKFEFSRQKIICAFRHLNKKCATKGLLI